MARVTHLSYDERRYRSAEDCLSDIRERVDLGWQVAQLHGPRGHQYLVVFRKEESREPPQLARAKTRGGCGARERFRQ